MSDFIIPEKPQIKLKEGFEQIWNEKTGRWAIRPVKGYSKIYLKKNAFVPKREETDKDYTVKDNVNSKLHKAKRDKNDEFYTRLEDIVAELKHYREFFKDKIVYCPCDKCFNEGRSNFFTYFVSTFHQLGIKKLICTQFNPNGQGRVDECDFEKCGIKWEYNGEYTDDYEIDESDIDTYFLKGNGSFCSGECKEIMSQCDIVVTNPPFSLFREFITQIMELDKQFLVIGNQNAITYKEIFPYIKENKIWLGYHNNVTYCYESPNGNELESNRKYVESKGLDPNKYVKVPSICWFTNLPHKRRNEELELYKKYSEDKYPRYDNYDAIDCGKVADIPMDYDGVIGVPITFLDKYCPTQFEIVKFRKGNDDKDLAINGKTPYFRILIRRK